MFSEEVGHRSSHLSPRLLTISFSAAKYVIMNHGTSLTMKDAFGGRRRLSLSIKEEVFCIKFLVNLWFLWYFCTQQGRELVCILPERALLSFVRSSG